MDKKDIFLPLSLKKAIVNGKTSLGDHPAFPPDDEEMFVVKLLTEEYRHLCEKVGDISVEEAKKELNSLMTDAIKREEPLKTALTELCSKIIYRTFDIPEDSVKMTFELCGSIDVSDLRFIPEPTSEMSFEDIDEINSVTERIYQRRMMNSVICGASLYYSSAINSYLAEIFEADPNLPVIYKRIIDLNTWLLYAGESTPYNDSQKSAGRVDVYPGNESTKSKINAKGVIFPFLLAESIKGVLELAESKGLPDEFRLRKYITGKADFRMAELWDNRIGLPLWKRILSAVDAIGMKMKEIGINFLVMELSSLKPDEFNTFMSNLLAGTKKGNECIETLCSDILDSKEEDDFDDFIEKNNNQYTLEDDYFRPGEICQECMAENI